MKNKKERKMENKYEKNLLVSTKRIKSVKKIVQLHVCSGCIFL